MGTVIVVGFDGCYTALGFLRTVATVGGLVLNEGAFVVVARDPQGQFLVLRFNDEVVEGVMDAAAESSVAEFLMGSMMSCPCIGDFHGPAAEAPSEDSGKDLAGIGIDDDFSNQARRLLTPDSSAIGLVVWDDAPGEIFKLPELTCGKVIH